MFQNFMKPLSAPCLSLGALIVLLLLTLYLLMSYTEILVKPEILTSHVYGPMFGNAESRLSLYLVHNVTTLNQCRKFSSVTVVCKHFASYQDFPNYKWDLIR
jgi:hypothetical protein